MTISRRDFLSAMLAAGAIPKNFAFSATQELAKKNSLPEAEPIACRVTQSTAEIQFIAKSGMKAKVHYGTSPDALTNKVSFDEAETYTAKLTELFSGTRYYYQVEVKSQNNKKTNYLGDVQSFVTQRSLNSDSFSFAVLADSHYGERADLPSSLDQIRETARNLSNVDIDFCILVGDESYFDGKEGKRNAKAGIYSQEEAYERYALYRDIYAPIFARSASFLVLGNHDGEKLFDYLNKKRALKNQRFEWAPTARKIYAPNPLSSTYPEGGESTEDLQNYFAWTWGNALFIVIDPYHYTQVKPKTPDEWDLGKDQLAWLEKTLANSSSKYKFVIAHHLIGGAPYDSKLVKAGAGGRGGAQWATLGQQKTIHKLMKNYGAQYFLYGHDHIFVESEADGIKYFSCGKSANVSAARYSQQYWNKVYNSDYYSAPGYTLFTVSPEGVEVKYVISSKENKAKVFKFNYINYRVSPENTIEVEDDVIDVIKVWATDDETTTDIYQGGSFSGKKITLGPKAKGINMVKVIYVGQTIFQKQIT